MTTILILTFTYHRCQTSQPFFYPPPLPQGRDARLSQNNGRYDRIVSSSSSRRGSGWGGLQSSVYLQTVRRGQTKQHPTGCYKQPTDSNRSGGEETRIWWCSRWRTGWRHEGRESCDVWSTYGNTFDTFAEGRENLISAFCLYANLHTSLCTRPRGSHFTKHE